MNTPTPEATTTAKPYTIHSGDTATLEQGESSVSPGVGRDANTMKDAEEAESEGDETTAMARVTSNQQEADDGRIEVNVGALFNPSPVKIDL